MGDNIAGPSLLLARQDLAHREHLHQHNHNHLHRRHATTIFTEVVATISVVQQVDVDINGSTYSTETLTTESSPPITNGNAANGNAATKSAEGPAVGTPAPTGGGGSQASQSLPSDQGITSTTTPITIPTHFPTLVLSTNSTSCKSLFMLIEQPEDTDRVHSNIFNF